ncbi:hypothetical protein K438DRAFT_2085822 [Mycena galopus ATCC 62051]|nr:hypothetical protein K438DRAFT_2085822 [Mycena galopus ATCC 62051]
MAPDFLIVRSRVGATDTPRVGGPDTVTPHVGAPDTVTPLCRGRSRVSHKDFAPDTGNVGTADPASDMIHVRLKVSATYLLSVWYNFSRYNSLSDTLGVRYTHCLRKYHQRTREDANEQRDERNMRSAAGWNEEAEPLECSVNPLSTDLIQLHRTHHCQQTPRHVGESE